MAEALSIFWYDGNQSRYSQIRTTKKPAEVTLQDIDELRSDGAEISLVIRGHPPVWLAEDVHASGVLIEGRLKDNS